MCVVLNFIRIKGWGDWAQFYFYGHKSCISSSYLKFSEKIMEKRHNSQLGWVPHDFSLPHLSSLWKIGTGINLMYMWNKHSTKCFTYFMVKRSSTLIKEGKIALSIDEERLHRTKEKNREIISKGKEEKWERQTKAAYQINGVTEPWGQNEGI